MTCRHFISNFRIHSHLSSSYIVILTYHLHYSLVLMLTPTTNSSQMELRESVLFQPVLQAYPTRYSWIITAHISLGNLECHWKLFTRQPTRTQQFLRSLDQHPSAPAQLQIYRRCSDILLTPYLHPCTYQFPQRTPYISTGI